MSDWLKYDNKMTNAKDEFLEFTKNKPKIICAHIINSEYEVILPLNYIKEDMDEFLSKIDYRYDSGYGSQNLFGFIWFDGGSWAEREEYDGSEWWAMRKCPHIPDKLKKI
jgi:hypothetical protein